MESEKVASIQEKIHPICERRGVAFAAIFGSFARGEETDGSDIDILVRFNEPKSLIDLVGFEHELEDVLGRDVDVVTERGLCHHIKDQVLRDLQPIYGR